MTFPIPNSLQEYFGNLAVRNAVDSLAAALDGENAPQMGWDEARNYNQALLMAAQVRADLVDLLFRVWDATFGQANTLRLGVEYFDGQEDGFPAAVWRERHVERYYYPDEQDCGKRRAVGWSLRLARASNKENDCAWRRTLLRGR